MTGWASAGSGARRGARRGVDWGTALVAAVALAVLGWGASRHGLHFVDLVGFSRRARELAEHRAPSDGLYPLGYPALLALGHLVGAPILGTARALGVAAGVGLVAATARRLGPVAGLWLLVQLPLLTWATTEGTDLPAAALALSGVLLAGRHPTWGGALVGAACCLRWTAGVWVPAVVFAAPVGTRLRCFAAAVFGTVPHWLAGAWCGAVVLPDQGLNLAIAAGPGAPPAGSGVLAALARVPEGLGRAGPFVLPDVYARAGAAAALLAALVPTMRARGTQAPGPDAGADRRLAAALVFGGAAHTVLLAAVFANARLAVPAALAASFGVSVAARRLGAWRPVLGHAATALLLAATGWFASHTVPRLEAAPAEAELVRALHEALAGVPVDGAVMSNSPLAHTEREGWLVPGVQLGGLYVTPATTPAELGRIADQAGLRVLVLDPTRGKRDTAGLAALREADAAGVDGWVRRHAGRWRVWERE